MSGMEKIETKINPLADQPTYKSALPMTVGALTAGVVGLMFPQMNVSGLGLFALATISVCLAVSVFLKRRLGGTWQITHPGVRSILFLAHASFGFALVSVFIGFISYLKG